MPKEAAVTTLSRLIAGNLGVFRSEAATALGVTRNQLARLAQQRVIERVLPHTYRMTAITPSGAQETNGRRWHDDPHDNEHDNEKWSVPGCHGYGIVFATWDAVTGRPRRLLDELTVALAA